MTLQLDQADLAPAPDDVDGRVVATLRLLAADMVEAANSGHPGLPMGAATMAWALWSRVLRHDPARPTWPDRDRFVLSAGHGSALLYALLHVTGYDLGLEDLAAFRQWGSRTPGHPEVGVTPGVETSTGPLGQGIANGVGMALAERMLAARFRAEGLEQVVDHRTFVLVSDGDLMEGISQEAASLAGHLGLGRLVVLWDDNQITIDGEASLAFTEDVRGRFEANGWHVVSVDDGQDLEAVVDALEAAVSVDDRPSLVAVRTRIGFGAPEKEGTSAAHGAPLGASVLAGAKERLGWPAGESFVVPPDVVAAGVEVAEAGRLASQAWDRRYSAFATAEPDLAAEWERARCRELPAGAVEDLADFEPGGAIATRAASGTVLTRLAELVPELVGGSADLAGSTNVALPGGSVAAGDYRGRQVNFGVREHAMGAVLNGMALHGGLRPIGSTFLVFADYMRPAIRLAALMELPVAYVFTHDSIAVGEDGPTHQPVEHLAALRVIPGLAVVRPADANEAAEAWRLALERTDGPTALVLSRQSLPVLEASESGWLAETGARIAHEPASEPAVVLVASGSEVSLALRAATELEQRHNVAARVVSMAWPDRFRACSPARRAELLPVGLPRVVVEAGSARSWEAIAGDHGVVIGLDRFGASAPGATVMSELGFTTDAVVAAARGLLAADDTDGQEAQ